MTVLLVLAAITAVVLAGICIDIAVGGRRLRSLADVSPSPDLPALSVIVAARNEARGIELALRSLLRLDYPGVEIIVVNDRSTDDTGAILRRMAQDVPRLRVRDVSELPAGWLGKNHAMAVGATEASGEYLLFTDADVVFEPTVLARAVSLMERGNIDHLAAAPDVRVPGLALNAFVSAFGVFFLLYSRPWKASDPRSRHHIGIGAFNLIRASVYRAVGTHRAIAMRPDDDMKLGKLVKKHGFRQEAVIARDMVVVEWYSSLREAIDGLTKNMFAGVNYSLLAAFGSTTAILLLFVWPLVGAFVTRGTTRSLNGICVLMTALIVWAASRGRAKRFASVIGFPVSALLFLYALWRSALTAVTRGTIAWRGTEYPLEEMRANRI